jgi:hypothetical protein
VEKGDHYLRLFRAFVKACGNAPRHPLKKQNGFVHKNGLLSRAANLMSSNR